MRATPLLQRAALGPLKALLRFIRDFFDMDRSISRPSIDPGGGGTAPVIVAGFGAAVAVFDATSHVLTSLVANYTPLPALAAALNYLVTITVATTSVYFLAAKKTVTYRTDAGQEQNIEYRYPQLIRMTSKIVFAVVAGCVIPVTVYSDMVLPLRLPPIIGVRVICSDSGGAVSGAEMWIKDGIGNRLSTSAATDADGVFYCSVKKSFWIPYFVSVRTSRERASKTEALRTLRPQHGYWIKEVECGR